MIVSSRDLDAQARAILRDNDRGGFTIPTSRLYPYQWNWDSAFTALGLATFDVPRAVRELETLFECQWDDGMLPHIIFRADEPSYFPGPSVWQANRGPLPSSGISQPPVAAAAALAIANTAPEAVRHLYPKLNAWHRWWHRARDPEGLGVIGIIHPWESGRDNLPDWDKPGEAIDVSAVGPYVRKDITHVNAAMRPSQRDYDRYIALVQFGRARGWDQERIARESPFFVADVGITAIFLRAERDLLALAEHLGEPVDEIKARIARLEAGFDRLWNVEAGAYCSLDLRSNKHAVTSTAATFLAFYAGVTARSDALLALFDRYCAAARYGIASYDPASPLFDHIRYWRGPIWLPINYLIGRGLAETGDTERSDRVRADSARLVRTHGFAEYFSPVTGEGCGGGTFSWTAALWLAWSLSNVVAEDMN
jgi:glycogen debranching enzyme